MLTVVFVRMLTKEEEFDDDRITGLQNICEAYFIKSFTWIPYPSRRLFAH